MYYSLKIPIINVEVENLRPNHIHIWCICRYTVCITISEDEMEICISQLMKFKI